MSKKEERGSRGIQAVCLTLGGVAAGAAVAYTEVMTTVIARRRSRTMDRIKGGLRKPANPEAQRIREAAKELESLADETVSIKSRDGLTLKGHWYHAENPRRLVIMVHGWHSYWSRDFGISAPFYHDNGCEMLLVEQRCHGGSEGKMISYGIKERYDILDWLAYVRSVRTDLPIYLCGLSMGASTVLMTAGEDIAGQVSAIIADCGYTKPREIVTDCVGKTLGGAAGPTVAAVDTVCRLQGGFSLGAYSTLAALERNTEVPILFIHGDADDFVPCRMTLENYMACRAPKELYIVHGAAHATSYLKETETYRARILAFFDAWDGRLS